MGSKSKNRRWAFILLTGAIVSASCSANKPDTEASSITTIAELTEPTSTPTPATGENGSASTEQLIAATVRPSQRRGRDL